MAVGRSSPAAGTKRPVEEAALLRTGSISEHTITLCIGLQRVDVDDVPRPLGDLADLRLADRSLAAVGILALAGLRPRRSEPGNARARQMRGIAASPPAVGDERQPFRPCPKGVRLPPRPVHEAVAGPHLIGLAVLPGEPIALEDEEDLLLGGVEVRRRRPPPGLHADPVDTDADAARRSTHELPRAVDVPPLELTGLDVIPVDERHFDGRSGTSPSSVNSCRVSSSVRSLGGMIRSDVERSSSGSRSPRFWTSCHISSSTSSSAPSSCASTAAAARSSSSLSC